MIFFTPALADCLSQESEWQQKSSQVSGTLLSILADLNNAVVLVVYARSPISNFSSPFINPLGIVQSAPIIIIIIIIISRIYCTIFLLSLYHIYPTSPLGQDMTQGQFLSGV